jgi:protein-L-isoaspartate(D-aspartate) O-methyltransferase
MSQANVMAQNMVLGQIFTNKVHDRRILQAMIDTPREAFVPSDLRGSAYVDEDLDLGNGRALMAPMTLARLIRLAEITSESRVLNIGALTGYTAAVLARLAAHVTATELDALVIEQARSRLARLEIANVSFQQVKSLADGCAASAPYDVIIISGAIRVLPQGLEAQLSKGGRLVGVRNINNRPEMPAGMGKGFVARRVSNGLFPRDYFDAGATLLPGFEADRRFIF